MQVIGFSLGTTADENSHLAYDGRPIRVVVWFFSGLHQGLDWTENEESVFFTCVAESNVSTSPRPWEIDLFPEKLAHKHEVRALSCRLLWHDMRNAIPATLLIISGKKTLFSLLFA